MPLLPIMACKPTSLLPDALKKAWIQSGPKIDNWKREGLGKLIVRDEVRLVHSDGPGSGPPPASDVFLGALP